MQCDGGALEGEWSGAMYCGCNVLCCNVTKERRKARGLMSWMSCDAPYALAFLRDEERVFCVARWYCSWRANDARGDRRSRARSATAARRATARCASRRYHYITLRHITLRYIALQYTAYYSTVKYSTAQHSTAQHSAVLPPGKRYVAVQNAIKYHHHQIG